MKQVFTGEDLKTILCFLVVLIVAEVVGGKSIQEV